MQRYPIQISILLCGILLLGACAKQVSLPPPDEKNATVTWQNFMHAAASRATPLPFRLSGSLRYTTPQDAHRFSLQSWGNGDLPIRVDLSAGLGITVAKIRQGTNTLLAYSPQENVAILHPKGNDALFRMGIPVPFSIMDLNNLLTGRYTQLFSAAYQTVTLVPEDGFAYTLPTGRLTGSLQLDTLGRPLLWRGSQKYTGWTIYFSRYEETRFPAQALPRKLVVRYGKTHKAIILISQRNRPETAYTPDQLTLILPEGTQIRPLRPLRPPR